MDSLIISASSKPQKYSFQTIQSLRKNKVNVYAIGLKEAKVDDVCIHTGQPLFKNIHTIILYIGPNKQEQYYNYIITL